MLYKLLVGTIFISSYILSFSFDNNDLDLPKSALKKLEKTISLQWPHKDILKETISVSEKQKENLSFNIKSNQLFKLKNNDSLVGYLYLDEALGRFDKFDYMVIFDPDLIILTSRVLIYRSEHGGEITNKRWMKQFMGKSNGNGMEYEKDIQAISGATISARSISSSINKLTLNMQELRRAGVI